MKNKIIVLLSGGMDSSCLIYWLNNNGYSPIALFIDYGQKSRDKEYQAAKAISKSLGISLVKKSFRFKNNNGLLKDNIKNYYYPNRNLLLLTLASIYARENNIFSLAIGLHKSREYPDCSLQFVKAVEKAIFFSLGSRQIIYAPFIKLNKVGVYTIGVKLKVPYKSTFSCYESNKRHCMKCPSCKDRGLLLSKNVKI